MSCFLFVQLVTLPFFFPESSLSPEVLPNLFLLRYWTFSSLLNQSQGHIFTECKGIFYISLTIKGSSKCLCWKPGPQLVSTESWLDHQSTKSMKELLVNGAVWRKHNSRHVFEGWQLSHFSQFLVEMWATLPCQTLCHDFLPYRLTVIKLTDHELRPGNKINYLYV